MALHGIEKHHELQRTRILRDTRPLHEQVLEILSSMQAVVIIYVCLVFCLVVFPALFDIVLLLAIGYFIIPLNRKPDIPFRVRQSLHEIDHTDIHPATKKPQKSRGIVFIGNRKSDDAEVWLANADARQHFFFAGSTGAGKTEGLISLAFNALTWGSGFGYTDGKGDVSLFTKIFSMLRAMGREDDLFVINYMTGGGDTTKRRADKLSNTYNPFAVGNAESLIQLIVSLMDASEGKGDMWKGRAISFISSLLPSLVDLRDKGLLMLHIGAIREFLPFPKFTELMNNPSVSPRSRDMMQAFLLDVPGYKRDKGENQSGTFLEQYGYQQMQFTRILSSLADTYGHIYFTPQGEINLKDIVLNRRILLVLLPALEKSDPELANLGKIIVAGFASMMGVQLGNKLEGSKLELLDARATNAPTPFIGIFDEFGYYMPEGAAKMWAQARSLGFALVASGQDLQAFYRTSKEETLAIIGSSNFKVFGKVEDPTDTYDLIEKLSGEAYVSVVGGYNQDMNGVGGYKGSDEARIERVKRIELQDLKDQIEGEVHILVKSQIIRARLFYADPKQVSEYRLNHFLKVAPPNQDELEAMKVNTRAVLESLEISPFRKQRPTDGLFAYAKGLIASPKYQDYLSRKLGVERGICLLMNFDETAIALPADVEPTATAGTGGTEDAGGSGGGYQLAPSSHDMPALLAGDPTGTALLAAADQDLSNASLLAAPATHDSASKVQEDVIYDGGKLEAVTVFGGTPKQDPGLDILSMVMAAASVIETAAETKLVFPQAAEGTQGGALSEQEAGYKLNMIAKGLGASDAEAAATSNSIIELAKGASSYPTPPKPEQDKADTMDDVLSDLESILNGNGQ